MSRPLRTANVVRLSLPYESPSFDGNGNAGNVISAADNGETCFANFVPFLPWSACQLPLGRVWHCTVAAGRKRRPTNEDSFRSPVSHKRSWPSRHHGRYRAATWALDGNRSRVLAASPGALRSPGCRTRARRRDRQGQTLAGCRLTPGYRDVCYRVAQSNPRSTSDFASGTSKSAATCPSEQ